MSGRFAKKRAGGRKIPETPSRKEICTGDGKTSCARNRHVNWRFSREVHAILPKVVRNGLGQVIILADFVSRPRKLQRSAEVQAEVKRVLWSLSLYQFHACLFCAKTYHAMYWLDLPMQLKDAMSDPQARQVLLEGGDKVEVPCPCIEENGQVRWMYESSEIIVYLEGCFASA